MSTGKSDHRTKKPSTGNVASATKSPTKAGKSVANGADASATDVEAEAGAKGAAKAKPGAAAASCVPRCSSRAFKNRIGPVDGDAVLAAVKTLPIKRRG